MRRLLASKVAFCIFLATAVALQLSVRAYETETGNYPDEAAHFLNGMLLRDYLTNGLGQAPLRFAENYYLHYPKIAPAMWPPLYHVAEGLVLLPGWPPHTASLAFLALISAWASWRLYRLVSIVASPPTALAISVMFLFTPVVVDLTSSIMVDVVVAAIALEATYWLAMFFSSEKQRHAVLFGLFAACCCLTKGNGIAIVLVPVCLILITRRFDLLRKPGLYLSAAIVILLALPLLVISYRLDAAIGDFGPVSPETAVRRVLFYTAFLRSQLGTLVFVVAAVGLFDTVRRGWRKQNEQPMPVPPALSALCCSVILFHALTPHQEIEGRYVTLAVAPLLGLLPSAVAAIGTMARAPRERQLVRRVLACGLLVAFATAPATFTARRPLGFAAAARFLKDCDELAGHRVLVVSDANGEGAFVSEAAMLGSNPAVTVVRGTKLLAHVEWPGHRVDLLFPSPAAIMQELEDLHIKEVVFDASSDLEFYAYQYQIKELLQTEPDRLVRIYSSATDSRDAARSIEIYKVMHATPGPPKALRIDLVASLGRVLEQSEGAARTVANPAVVRK